RQLRNVGLDLSEEHTSVRARLVASDAAKAFAGKVIIVAIVVAFIAVCATVPPQRVADNELPYATAGAHSLFIGVREMNAFPDTCVDDLIDSLAEPEPEMIEGWLSRAVRDHRDSGFVTEEIADTFGNCAGGYCIVLTQY